MPDHGSLNPTHRAIVPVNVNVARAPASSACTALLPLNTVFLTVFQVPTYLMLRSVCSTRVYVTVIVGVIARLSVAVAFWALESATWTVNVLVPLPVGVPEIAPELAANERPAGKLPGTRYQAAVGRPTVSEQGAW